MSEGQETLKDITFQAQGNNAHLENKIMDEAAVSLDTQGTAQRSKVKADALDIGKCSYYNAHSQLKTAGKRKGMVISRSG